MTDLIKELKALKEKATPGELAFCYVHAQGEDGDYHAQEARMLCDGIELFDMMPGIERNGDWAAEDFELYAALVNHLPTILAKLEEGERMREALGRLVSEYDDDGEHGKHAYEQECPLCCAIEDARKFTALESTHDH